MKTKNAQTLSVHLDNEIVAMLTRRAAARGLSKSRYAAMVFAAWRDQKYPALDTVDSTARAVVLQQIADEKRAKVPGEMPEEAAPPAVAFAKPLASSASGKRKTSA